MPLALPDSELTDADRLLVESHVSLLIAYVGEVERRPGDDAPDSLDQWRGRLRSMHVSRLSCPSLSSSNRRLKALIIHGANLLSRATFFADTTRFPYSFLDVLRTGTTRWVLASDVREALPSIGEFVASCPGSSPSHPVRCVRGRSVRPGRSGRSCRRPS